MAISDARQVRRVRCPRCHSVLEEPSAPVYQCGGCGTILRAKSRGVDTQDVAIASPSRSGLPPPSRHLVSTDVASSSRSSTPTPPDARSSRHHQATDTTSRRETGDPVSAREHGSSDVASTSSTPGARSSRRHGTGTRSSRRESGDLVLARNRVSEQVPAIERKERDRSTSRGVSDNSEDRRRRDAGDAERSASSPGGSKDAIATELPDGASMKYSGEAAAARPRPRDRGEPAPASSARAMESRPARDASAAGGKAPSPPGHELQAENLAPLRKKILKTVDELKGDLSELFSKSPELNPTAPRARPPRSRRRPEQEGYVSRAAMASGLPARARHAAAAVNQRGGADRAVKPGQVAAAAAPLRGLPSRRYRRCRADPCRDNVQQPRPCHHGKPECGSCRGHCCRPPRAQEPSAPRRPPAAAKEAAKRRPPPRHHCRPVLKGAPFIVCSTCFTLVQVPAGFAVSTDRLRKLRCGSCSAVLSYSYRDPGRKKLQPQESIDQLSTDGSDEVHGVGRLHRLMGYGSANELLRLSPDLYESFDDERTTADAGHYDRKGKGVCVDVDDDVEDSDDEDGGVRKRSAARGSGWPLPGMLGKGVPGPGAIRIKS